MIHSWYRRRGKRLLDLALTIPTLLVLAPVIGIVALLVRTNIGRPVFFLQQRPGLNGKLFRVCKFRSMTVERDERGCLLPDDQRLTSFGRFIRKYSLDELPQLWNVLRGDMSLVGPRPLLMKYLELYTPEQARRHEVRPGLTGWAQVNGRNSIDWEYRFELDLWYVDRCSFSTDVKIIALTFLTTLRRQGISASDHVTMPEFKGTAAID